MKKVLLGFIAIGLLTFVGCEKDDENVELETNSDSNTNSDEEIIEEDPMNRVCINGELDTLCLNGTLWNYSQEQLDLDCNFELQENLTVLDSGWTVLDSGLVMLNEDSSIFYNGDFRLEGNLDNDLRGGLLSSEIITDEPNIRIWESSLRFSGEGGDCIKTIISRFKIYKIF